MEPMVLNLTSMRTSSDGVWQGDNPLNHAFPLLIVQTILVLIISRLFAFILKPFRQPKVIAEILGGILLGPSALGRIKYFSVIIFPSWSTPILESVADIGLLFYLFLVGLELDLSTLRRSSKSAITIALAGISLPFLIAVGVTYLMRKVINGENKVGYLQLLMFIGVALSITAFPVLARILAELKLLTTRIGETAMAAAAFNDVAAWILLALAVALAGGNHKGPLVSICVLISGVAFVAFMFTLVRPVMIWVANRCSSQIEDEAYIFLTLAGVMLSGFMTDLIGVHSIFGAFIFGLTIPKGGGFAAKLTRRIEDFVSGLLLPLYFASSGLKTDITKIQGAKAWGLLALIISVACTGKILGTILVALMCMIPVRESLALGVLMNTKGLVELIILNIGKEKKILNDEIFAILVLMTLFTTFMTTPTVMAIYKPYVVASQSESSLETQNSPTRKLKKQKEVRILACIHGPESVPSLINLIESTGTSSTNSLPKVYVMHLVELTDRSSSIMMVHRVRKNGLPFINRFCLGHIASAFQVYGQVSQATIRHTTAISGLSVMHEDILHVAEAKRVSMIVLPFNKQRNKQGEETIDSLAHHWKGVNESVLSRANCSVALFLDRGFNVGAEKAENPMGATNLKRVCLLFLGGPDDRRALEYVGGITKESVAVTLVRFKSEQVITNLSPMTNTNPNPESDLDETAVADFRRQNGSLEYIDKVVTGNIIRTVLEVVGQSRKYNLVIVGKQHHPSTLVSESAYNQLEHSELGPIGDALASSSSGILCSVLVIQTPKIKK